MSAVLDRPPAASSAAPSPRGSLLRAELHRFRARRFIQMLLALAVLGWLAAVVIGLLNYGHPDAGDYAAARVEVDRVVAQQNAFHEQCLQDSNIPDDVPPEMACGEPITADQLRVEDFLGVHPFSFVDTAQNGAMAFAAAGAVLCFLVGSTWIGAEWSSRSIVALLFWEPRRSRVMGSKLGVLVAATAVLGAAVQAGWLAMAGILSAAAGDGSTVPDGFWGHLLATEARSVLLAVLAGLLGFGLTNLVRNTGAALGIGFVYFAVLETAIRAVEPAWQPWLLTNNAVGLVLRGGLTLPIYDSTAIGPNGEIGYREYLLGNLQSGVFLAVVAAIIVAVGVVLFARRDVH